MLATCLQLAHIDSQAQESVPSLVLMEQAALRLWFECKQRIPSLTKQSKLVFLCGNGNNGGDALAVARSASSEMYCDVSVIIVEGRRSAQNQQQLEALSRFPVKIIKSFEASGVLEKAQILFDGLCGTGIKDILQGEFGNLVRMASNNKQAFKVAIDVPSGLGDGFSCLGGPVFPADLTITMGLEKRLFYHPLFTRYTGQIVVINPCFPPSLLIQHPSGTERMDYSEVTVGKLATDAYKKTRGSVAVFAGSLEYSGAARLACRSVFASRAGLVSLFVDDEYYPSASTESPSVMVKKLSEGYTLSLFSAILAGPGWGGGRLPLLADLLSSGKPMVLDADAIACFAQLWKDKGRVEHGPLVLTPHLGELETLSKSVLGQDIIHSSSDDFYEGLTLLSRKLDACIVCKSAVNHIAEDGRVMVLSHANPSLAVAGSGDVLSGIIVSFLAYGLGCSESAIAGCAVHQRAGDMARNALGYFDSTQLLRYVGRAIVEMER